LARHASKIEVSDSPAWKILQSRLVTDANVGDAPTESPVPVTSVIEMPGRDLMLFATSMPEHQGPVTFAGSLLVHVLAAAVIWFSLGYKPPSARVITEHYTIRQLDLSELAAEANARLRNPMQNQDAVHPDKAQPAPPSPPKTLANPGLQTLIQPDVPNPVTLPQEIPVPRVLLWSASKTVVKNIVPPLQKNPPAADVVPLLERPNQELRIADVNIASNNQLSLQSQVLPSTTSPIAAQDSIQVEQPPSSLSQLSATPTPAAILSVSDMQLQNGTAALPPVTESQKSDAQGGLAPGQGKNSSAQNASGVHATGSGTATDALGELSATPIALSKEGHFAAVIVGNDLEQEYPEIAGQWSGRIAYTAYLHVGLSKSWVLQYSLPPNSEAAAGGNVSRLEAPWPYTIVRPNLPPDAIGADALMIHGFINSSGQFEDLSVVFPQPFAIAQFVLTALQQWQFRAATLHGQPTRVEVLLIIPEQLE